MRKNTRTFFACWVVSRYRTRATAKLYTTLLSAGSVGESDSTAVSSSCGSPSNVDRAFPTSPLRLAIADWMNLVATDEAAPLLATLVSNIGSPALSWNTRMSTLRYQGSGGLSVRSACKMYGFGFLVSSMMPLFVTVTPALLVKVACRVTFWSTLVKTLSSVIVTLKGNENRCAVVGMARSSGSMGPLKATFNCASGLFTEGCSGGLASCGAIGLVVSIPSSDGVKPSSTTLNAGSKTAGSGGFCLTQMSTSPWLIMLLSISK